MLSPGLRVPSFFCFCFSSAPANTLNCNQTWHLKEPVDWATILTRVGLKKRSKFVPLISDIKKIEAAFALCCWRGAFLERESLLKMALKDPTEEFITLRIGLPCFSTDENRLVEIRAVILRLSRTKTHKIREF